MNDNEKSKHIAKMCNIKFTSMEGINKQFIVFAVNFDGVWLDGTFGKNLYNVQNLPLVWQVLNWRSQTRFFNDDMKEGEAKIEFNRVLLRSQDLPLADAVREWLDKIFTLAIESGKISLLHESGEAT